MNNTGIPEGWVSMPFSKAVTRFQTKGGKLKTIDYLESGSLPVVDQGQKEIVAYTDKVECKFQGPYPIIVFGDHTRNVKLLNFEFSVGADGVVLLRPKDERSLDIRFLYYWLNYVPLHNLGYSRHFKLLKDKFISFPESIDEQRRIVARIEELTRRAEEATQLRQASIKDVQICYRAAISQIFNNADEACLHKLGKKVAIIGGNSIPETAPKPQVEDDRIGLMKVSDMNSKGNELYIRQCHLETDRTTAKNLRLRVLPVGSIVFPKRGGAIATNKKRMLTIPTALDPNLMGVYPLAGSKLRNSYLYWWFESLDLALLQEDGGIPQVNKKHIEPLMIPIPDETEQDVIVKKLNRIQNHHNRLISLQREIEAEMAMFQPALLAKAFRGGL